MFIKSIAEEKQLLWTRHAKEKMRFYQLSERRIKRVLKSPDREEKGVAPRTVALMQKAGSKKHPYEIWLMYQIGKNPKSKTRNSKRRENKIKIISAWRYPGISPVGEPPIPEDVLRDLRNFC